MMSLMKTKISERKTHINNLGFTIVTPSLLSIVESYQPIVEVFAGTGYFNTLALECDIDIVSFDNLRWQRAGTYEGNKVRRADAVEAIETYPDRNVYFSWPPLNEPHAYHAAKAMKKDRYLLCVSEGRGGACADDDFYDYLDSNFEFISKHNIPQFEGINDYLHIHKKILT